MQLIITGLEKRSQLKALQLGNYKQVTLIASINAASYSILLFIILTSQYYLSAQYKDAVILRDQAIIVSNNSQTTNKLRVEQLEHFNAYIKARIVGARQLLILNSYKSHYSLKFQEICKENNIYTLYILPYLSYFLQPLNVSCFLLLKRAYSRKIKSLICNYINYVTKLKFLPALKAAYN